MTTWLNFMSAGGWLITTAILATLLALTTCPPGGSRG